MLRWTLVFVGLSLLAAPAQAADEVLGVLPGAAEMSAYGGWIAFSTRNPSGGWSLQTWHDGVVAAAGVADRAAPFDVDVGPDAAGRPTAVYSRCRDVAGRGPAPLRPPIAPTDCDLFAVTLGIAGERRLGVSRSRYSEFAPSIWGRLLAFGRRSRDQRKADIYVARPGRPLKRLGPGTLAPCREAPCRDEPSTAWPRAMDLGAQAVAYDWQMRGGDTFLGEGTELRVAKLDGSRARIADTGWSSGECEGTATFSPNVTGTTALYGYRAGACYGTYSFRRFDHRGARRLQAPLPGESTIVALAWDGATVYWLRGNNTGDDCLTGGVCELLRSRDLPFTAMRGGETRPPI